MPRLMPEYDQHNQVRYPVIPEYMPCEIYPNTLGVYPATYPSMTKTATFGTRVPYSYDYTRVPYSVYTGYVA